MIWPTWHRFGRKTNQSRQKNSLNESSWFEQPKFKLRSKFAHFFVFCFFHCFFLISLLKFCENGRRFYGLRTLLRAHQFLHFMINSKIKMIDFVNSCKVIVRKSAFSTFLSVWNESENKKLEKTMKEKKKKKGKRKEIKSKVNLILLTCQSHIFYIGLSNWTLSL